MSKSRRDFMKNVGLGTAALGVAPALRTGARAQSSPSERLAVGVIGCKGMGSSDMNALLEIEGVECAALCDVDSSVLEERQAHYHEQTGVKPETFGDYRKLLERKDLDAVIIATPDHWHCKIFVDACDAGKDVYVEKPMANSIREIELMQQAAKHHDRVVQVGQWQRSGAHWDEAMEYLWSGAIGEVRTAKAWAYMGWDAPASTPDTAAPDGVDYDMWLGPAPKRPFNEGRFHWNWRWHWDYAGGLMTDWGVHLIDIVLLGMKATAPKSVVSLGGKFGYPDSGMETPDTQTAIYEFEDFSMIWESALGIALGPFQRGHGVAFVGNNGTLVVDRGGWEVIPELEMKDRRRTGHYRMEAIPPSSARRNATGLLQHTENFVECIKTREQPKCNQDVGALAAVNAHLGNIALRTGSRVEWNEKKARFEGNPQADALLTKEYHNGWTLPSVGGSGSTGGQGV